MTYHKRTEHFEEKPFTCDDCGAKFGANSSLKNHMRLHTGEKPYRCKHCDMSFGVAAALAYHTKKKHSEGKHAQVTPLRARNDPGPLKAQTPMFCDRDGEGEVSDDELAC